MQIGVLFNDLKIPSIAIMSELEGASKGVFQNGFFILGNQLESFEKEFAEYCGVRYVVGVGSGTEALHLALLSIGIQPGDQVITVPNTAVATVAAISFAQAHPVFVDIDSSTYTIDVGQLESQIKKINRKKKLLKAIIPVHLYGQCADMEPLLQLAKRYDLKVIEDACQSHGALYMRQKAGSMGDIGCFSFYPTKNLGAYGDGGAIVTNNKRLASRVRMLRNYGEQKKYVCKIKGFNSRLDELQAAFLRIKLRHLDKWNEMRRKIAGTYNDCLRNTKVIIPEEIKSNYHVYHLYVVRHRRRDALKRHLHQYRIETAIHYPIPIHLQKAYSDLSLTKGAYPISEKVSKEILSLPIYPHLSESQIEYVCNAIKQFDRV